MHSSHWFEVVRRWWHAPIVILQHLKQSLATIVGLFSHVTWIWSNYTHTVLCVLLSIKQHPPPPLSPPTPISLFKKKKKSTIKKNWGLCQYLSIMQSNKRSPVSRTKLKLKGIELTTQDKSRRRRETLELTGSWKCFVSARSLFLLGWLGAIGRILFHFNFKISSPHSWCIIIITNCETPSSCLVPADMRDNCCKMLV